MKLRDVTAAPRDAMLGGRQSKAATLVTLTDAQASNMMNAARGNRSRHGLHKTSGDITRGTWLSSGKASHRQIVAAAMLFCSAKKGMSSLQMARTIGMQQCTIYKMMMKFRNAILAESLGVRLHGVVEVDGAFFGGHVRHENAVKGGRQYRYSRRNKLNRKTVVVLRQRGGRTLTFVGDKEFDAIGFIKERVDAAAVIHSDQSHAWDGLSKLYKAMRINHKMAFVANDACTNNAESFFGMLRRMQMGTHHKISGQYLHLYAAEMAWRLDHAALSEQEKVETLLRLVLTPKPDTTNAIFWTPAVRRPARRSAQVETRKAA